MHLLEIFAFLLATYVTLLLALELFIWKLQPDMDGVVTLHIGFVERDISRKLYGFRHDEKLYVSSNHWFRGWYRACLECSELQVESSGALATYTATAITGTEERDVSQAYGQGLFLRMLCGFAPRRFLRLDPKR